MAEGLKLSSIAHDISVVNGKIETISDKGKVSQDVKTRLLSSKGEFLFDKEYGFPYNELFSRNLSSVADIESEVKVFILETLGVIRLTRFLLNFIGAERKLTIDFTTDTIYGDNQSEVSLNVGNG